MARRPSRLGVGSVEKHLQEILAGMDTITIAAKSLRLLMAVGTKNMTKELLQSAESLKPLLEGKDL